MADFTTDRFFKSYDAATTYVNLLTASEPGGNTGEGLLPLALPSDREAMEVALFSSLASDRPLVCRAKSTASLEELLVSECLVEQVKRIPSLEIVGESIDLPFDSSGNLF